MVRIGSAIVLLIILAGCRPVAPIGMDIRNCDPSKRVDCYAVTHDQLQTLFNKLESQEAELEQLNEAYTFCKEGI